MRSVLTAAFWMLSSYGCCNDPTEAIPKKYTEGKVFHDIKMKAVVAGERWKGFRWGNHRVLWQERGVYQLERGGDGQSQ
eukprot:5973150-Lingulodinium_polyedra.AAC.1